MDYESGLVKPATQIDERWLRRLKHAPDRVAARLVIFPHAGGSASYFRPMEQFLHPQIDVLAGQYPGRQDRRREPCLTSVNALVDGVLPALKQLTGCPLALFGHSLGASVAFEAARRLHALDIPVHTLFASGRPGPRAHRDLGWHRVGDAAFLQEIQRLNGTDARLLEDPEIVEFVLPALRADYRAAELYVYHPGPLLDCPIVALHGDMDDFVPDFDVADWRHETTSSFRLERFSGGHFYLVDHWKAIAALVGEAFSLGTGVRSAA